MGPLLRLSLKQLAGRTRLVVVVLLAALPVVLIGIIRAVGESDPDEFAQFTLDGMLVAAILPIVIMALATSAFGHELEDRTLSYLVLKPIARWRIVAPKYLAVLLVGGPLLIVSAVVSTLIGLDGDIRAAVAVGVAMLLGVAAYSSIFTWAGLMTSRALGFALVYVFLWEGLLSSFLGGVRYLSVRGYALAVMYGIDERSLEELGAKAIELPAAIGGALGVTVLFLWLTVRRLRRMDVP